jgi:hypothetical protein
MLYSAVHAIAPFFVFAAMELTDAHCPKKGQSVGIHRRVHRSSRHRQQDPRRAQAPAHRGTTLRPLTLPAPQEGNAASSPRKFRPQVGEYLIRRNRANKPGIKVAAATLYFVKPRLFYARLRRAV